MGNKGWGALYGLCVGAVLGWGLTGLVAAGCDRGFRAGRGSCGVPDGHVVQFVVCAVALVSLAGLGWTVLRTDDWRPSLGLSAGALIALAITLSAGTTTGFLVLAAAEAAVAVVVPPVLYRLGRRARAVRV